MDYKEYYDGKRVLVTGGVGAVGSRLTRVLLELGATVLVLDDLSSAYEWNLASQTIYCLSKEMLPMMSM